MHAQHYTVSRIFPDCSKPETETNVPHFNHSKQKAWVTNVNKGNKGVASIKACECWPM